MGAGKERPLFPALDIVRGFATVTVVIYHVIECTRWAVFRCRPRCWARYDMELVDVLEEKWR